MTDFIINKLLYDLTSNTGLALVGQYIKRLGLVSSGCKLTQAAV